MFRNDHEMTEIKFGIDNVSHLRDFYWRDSKHPMGCFSLLHPKLFSINFIQIIFMLSNPFLSYLDWLLSNPVPKPLIPKNPRPCPIPPITPVLFQDIGQWNMKGLICRKSQKKPVKSNLGKFLRKSDSKYFAMQFLQVLNLSIPLSIF